MKIIQQTWQWIQKPHSPLQIIESAGRTCYKSEDKITDSSAEKFAHMLVSRKHLSVIEHISASVRFITNRGVTHELVRHRLCAFSQESTRYVRYNDEMFFIQPVWWDDATEEQKTMWTEAMDYAEKTYCALIDAGWRPEQAREVLPNSLKTDIVMTANLREWRNVFQQRTATAAHPQIRALMIDCLKGFKKEIPVLFDDI